MLEQAAKNVKERDELPDEDDNREINRLLGEFANQHKFDDDDLGQKYWIMLSLKYADGEEIQEMATNIASGYQEDARENQPLG